VLTIFLGFKSNTNTKPEILNEYLEPAEADTVARIFGLHDTLPDTLPRILLGVLFRRLIRGRKKKGPSTAKTTVITGEVTMTGVSRGRRDKGLRVVALVFTDPISARWR